jgi:hypothetical protein
VRRATEYEKLPSPITVIYVEIKTQRAAVVCAGAYDDGSPRQRRATVDRN